ncbi:porphobilinogen deaminase [Oleoguttula sp. CCFEE 5521]
MAAPPPTARSTSTSPQTTIHVGTRQSLLARLQADEVVAALRPHHPNTHFEIHAMATTGDNNQSTALHKFNEKALWTQELEVKLEDREVDFVVHSLKDMPTQLPKGLVLGGVTRRGDKRDALVLKKGREGKGLADLGEGEVVGTSSLRRTAQLKRFHPGLRFRDVRGNIGTRLAKLDAEDGEYAAIVIAVAGLVRLGLTDRITSYLSKDNGGMLHAVGQGGLGIEIREGDTRIEEVLKPIICERSMRAALVERSLMRTLEGGCSVPIGIETKWVSKKHSLIETSTTGVGVGIKPAEPFAPAGTPPSQTAPLTTTEESDDDVTDELAVSAIVVSLDGQDAAEVETSLTITTFEEAEEFGIEIARLLVEQGAARILKAITLNRDIIHKQGDA